MALYDAADLLSRVKVLALRPSTDEETSDAQWYSLLTEAQAYWQAAIAQHAPWLYWSAPTAMTTIDGGLTYQFASSITPLKVEVYSELGSFLLKPCAPWDMSGDYIWEGNQVRWPGNRTNVRTPYVRTISAPSTLDGSTPPTLKPDYARPLLVYYAVAEWADRGGLRDPAPFRNRMNEMWYNPQNGTGVLISIKTQNPYQGAAAWGTSDIAPTSIVDTGSGYTPVT